MSVEFVAVAVALLVVMLVVGFVQYSPAIILEVLDHLIWTIPARPFLAVAPTQHPLVRSVSVAVAIVCGFGMVLTLSRAAGLWIVWPAAALVLFLAAGFGAAFATMIWPVTLTIGFIALRFGLGILERAGGEPVPFPADDGRVAVLNVMTVLTFLLSGYASAIAIRARKPSRPTAPVRSKWVRER